MKSLTLLAFRGAIAVGLTLLALGAAATADEAKVSSYAPAADLASQVGELIERLEKAVASEDDYNDSTARIGRDANTLSVVALALGIHDEDNPYKKAAPGMIKACQDLAAAADYAAAKSACEAVKKASTDATGDPTSLKWEKVASLPELMAAVPLINTKMKRGFRGSRFKKKAKDTAGQSAVLAAIAQGSIANSGDTEKPDEVDSWTAYCIDMRDAAAEVNAAIHAQDQDATQAAVVKLTKSCDDCHAVFHEAALGTGDVEDE